MTRACLNDPAVVLVVGNQVEELVDALGSLTSFQHWAVALGTHHQPNHRPLCKLVVLAQKRVETSPDHRILQCREEGVKEGG